MSDEETGTEMDIDDEVVDIVGGTPALAISGVESESFIFSEIVRREGLEQQTLLTPLDC